MSKMPYVTDLANVRRFNEGIGSLATKTGGNANFCLLSGPVGLGKTEAIIQRSSRDGHPLIRAKRAWNIRWMLSELSEALGLAPAYRTQDLYVQVRDRLIAQKPVVYIDELDHVISNKDLIETLRDLSDETGAKIVLIGMEGVRSRIAKYPVLDSRISVFIEFTELSEADVATVIQEALPPRTDEEHERDALRLAAKLTGGNFRRLADLIDKLDVQMRMGKMGHITLSLVREVANLKGL